MRARLSNSLAAVRGVFANRELRRVQIAWLGGNIGHFAYFVAISVFTFEAGGAGAVGVAAVARMVPAAVITPFAAALADRHRRQRVMAISDLLSAAALAAAALAVIAELPAALVIGLAALAAVAGSPFEPAKSALLPTISRTPEELTAANLVSSTIESVTLFLGPALAGVVLAAWGTAAALFLAVACLLWSAAFVAGVRAEAPQPGPEAEGPGALREALAGFSVLGGDARIALVAALFAAQTFVFGAFSVLVVVLALELLETGDAGVGYLNSALGVGALVGAGATLGLVGRRRLASGLGVGIVLWGLAFGLAGLAESEAVALGLLAAVGLANTLTDVSGFTLLQRLAPEAVAARVFGALETAIIAAVALGSLLAPLAIDALGEREAFGALLSILALLAWPRLRALDAAAPAPTRRLELLEGLPLFSPLGPVPLEELAERLSVRRYSPGEAIVTQGESGQRFYVVSEGEVEVAVDGRPVATQGPGSHFGEIALLRDVPRTATVTAAGEVEAYALEREAFLDAVTGHPRSNAAAEAVIGARLGRARPAAATSVSRFT